MWIGIAVFGSILALATIIIGRRGFRIDDHPLCRRCRFDLSGIPLTTCPECGGGIVESNVLIGNRRIIRGIVPAGLALLAVSVSIGVFLGPWNSPATRPLQVLILQADVEGWKPGRPAFTQISARLSGLPLTPGEYDQIASRLRKNSPSNSTSDAFLHRHLVSLMGTNSLSPNERGLTIRWALARHADPAAGWTTELGDLLCHARSRGLVTDAEWNGFLARFVSLHIAAPAPFPIAADRPLQLVLEWTARTGSDGVAMFTDLPLFGDRRRQRIGDPLTHQPMSDTVGVSVDPPSTNNATILQGNVFLWPETSWSGFRTQTSLLTAPGPGTLTNTTPIAIPFLRADTPANVWRGARVREELITRISRSRRPDATGTAASEGRVFFLPVGDAIALDFSIVARAPAGDRILQRGSITFSSDGCAYAIKDPDGFPRKGEIRNISGIAIPWHSDPPLAATERFIVSIDDARPYLDSTSYAFDPFEIDLTDTP
jgi:hypothetical protein